MSRKSRRAASMVVVFVMLISLVIFQAGCGKTDNSQTAATTAGSQANASTTAPQEQPVEVTILAPAGGLSFPSGVQDDDVAKEITKQTGVIMNITTGQAAGDVASKIAAMLATGDLPDITFFPTTALMQSALTAKATLALDDYLPQYGQDLAKNAPFMIKYSTTNISDTNGNNDGKFHFLLNMVGAGYDTAYGFGPYIRWDLYKKLGCPKINTIDDVIPILQQMMKLEPTNPEGKKNYGVAFNFADGPWSGDIPLWCSIPGLYGWGCGDYTSISNMLDNKYITAMTDPNSMNHKAAKWLNQAYRAGVMDPESFTMKSDQLTAKFTAGRVLFDFFSGYIWQANNEFTKKDDKVRRFVEIPPPADTTAVLNAYNLPQGNSTNGFGVSAKCKHPEAAMKLLNYFASFSGSETMINGLKGQRWDEVDGKAVLKPEVIENIKNPDPNKVNEWMKTGAGKYNTLLILTANTIDPKYNSPVNFAFQPEVSALRISNPVEKDSLAYYNVTVPFDMITKNPDIKKWMYDGPDQALIPAAPKDIADISAKSSKYCLDNFIKMVLAKTDDQFKAEQDKFIAGLKSLNYETAVKWFEDQRQIALTKLNK